MTGPPAAMAAMAVCVEDEMCQPKKSKCGAKTSSYLQPGSGQP